MNKTWKELLCMVLSAVMVLGLAACGSSKAEASAGDGDSTSGDTAADSIVLKMSTAQPEEHIASQTALRFADLIEQGTNGAVTVKMYFANSLGAQDVIVQGLMDGSIDLSLEFIDSTYNPVFEVQSLPFIASNFDEMEYIFSPGSQVYSLVDKGFSDIGIKLLGVYCEGLTGVSCKNMPESYNTWDQKKEPIRVWNSAVAKAGMTAMGYNTVAMTWSDTYSSIQTGIVNGSVGQTSLGVYTNLRDVVNYFIPYNFGAEFVHLAMSSTSWGKLTADQQKVVQDAATQVCKEIFDSAEQTEADGFAMLKEAGIEVLELSDADRSAIAQHVREEVWPAQEEILGKEAMDAIYADLKACAKKIRLPRIWTIRLILRSGVESAW